MEFKGKVINILPLEKGTSKAGKEWQKASVIVETTENPKYPKKVKLSAMKDADKFAALPVGSEWLFHVEVESREFNSRWYTDVNCWKWDAVAQMAPQQGYCPPQGYQLNPALQYPQQQTVPGQMYQTPPLGAGAFVGQQVSYPVNPNSTTPTLDSMGVTGYQPQQNNAPLPQGNDDLPF